MSEPSIQPLRLADLQPPTTAFQPLRHFSDPKNQIIPTASYDESWEDGYRRGKAEAEAENHALLQMLSSADALQPEPSDELAALIAETVIGLVTQIVGTVEIDRKTLIERAHKAADLISECDNARSMWVHPDDLALLRNCDLDLSLIPDHSALRGSIRIDCSPGWIEHGTSFYLEALRAELGLKETDG
jgi:flagellar assembly protein FliH